MAKHETTFGSLQVDERFNKLQRSLKLAILKQEHRKSAHDGKTTSMITWPSISSINVDNPSSNCATPSMQSSSEILGLSSNLRNVLLKKKSCNIKQEGMTTSSIKEYHAQQDNHVDRFTMPPPASSTVYRASKEPPDQVRASYNVEKAATSVSRTIQSSIPNTFSLKSTPSWISTSTSADKKYSNIPVTPPISTKVDRVFSKWRVMLNDQYELIIKGTIECGKIARSKPVIRRYSAICVESKYKNKYVLQGNIVDERNVLPDYIRGKFYNGFPDDWENVYQIWRTYVSKGYPAKFRWPTPITDSDDDLRSELTDLTYACVKNNDSASAKESCNLQCTKFKNLNNVSEKKEKYKSTCNLQIHEKNTSFVKSISDLEKDVIPVVQTKNPLRDEDKQNVNPVINPPSGTKKVSKLNDILQEDKLNIIINNLVDKNCSQKYIDKIIEMFDCLDYVVSYRSGSECNNSMVTANYKTSNNSAAVSLQRSDLLCDDNRGNANKLTDLKNYGHSTDLGYGSIKNDFNAMQLSNPIKPGHDDDSDKSESETYAGIPKISIERVLKAREISRNAYKRKVREKTVYPVAPKHASSNLPCNAESEVKFGSVYTNPVADTKKNSLSEDSCISITEDEVEITHDTRKCREAVDIIQRPQEMTFSSHRETQENNLNVYGGGKSATHVQDDAEAQKDNLNVFIKQHKVVHRNIQENVRSQVVDYTNSDVDVTTVSTNTRKTGRSTIASHTKTDQDIVINNESNSDSFEKPCAAPNLHREFIESTETDAIKKSKPTIISSRPVNLKLKICRVDSKDRQPHDSKIIVKNEDKQNANIRPLEESDKKSMLKTSVAAKSAINNSHSNPTNAQPKSSKLRVERNPKVLTAWTPNLVYDAKSELGLVFQGKLLNEAGHVMVRKFTTDIVARRLSATLIETKNHEFYELLGHLNDNNHTIPKELARQCRYGCPAKIEQFCLTWETLQHEKAEEIKEKFHDTTVKLLNTRVSSRGRHILPPLCYWTGERITLKNNNPVYSPGNSQESLLLPDNSKVQKESMDIEKRKNQKVNSSKKQNINEQILLPESCKISDTNKNHVQDSKTSSKTANNVKRSNNLKKPRKAVNSRRLAQKLTFSSTSSSEEEQEVSPRKRMRNSQTNENVDPKASSQYTMTLRKRQKIEKSSNKILRKHATKHYADYYSPTKRNKEMTYIYYQNIPQSKDFLSENEVSSI